MVICNPAYASLFKAGDVGASRIALDSVTGFAHAYGSDAQIADYSAVLYYIRQSGRGAGSSLYRHYLNTNRRGRSRVMAEELVEGVENMQLVYGVDSNNDGVADKYVNAALVNADHAWAEVVAVRVGCCLPVRTACAVALTARPTLSPASALRERRRSHPCADHRKRYVSAMTVSVETGKAMPDRIYQQGPC